ncbi:LOW QUALITY PROTEIN: synergin gamma-like [Saccoglossus kowalevskii]
MSSGQQKTKKTFHQKTALKDAPTVNKSQTTSTSFSESNKSRKWDNSEELSDMFVIPQPAPAVPAATEPSSTATGPPAVAPVPATTIITTADVHNTQLSTHSNTTISQPTSAANLASMPSTQSVFTPPKWCENEMNLPIVYRHVLEATLRNGRIETELLYPIFLFSGLEKQVLGHIWSLCNNTTPGMLTKQEAFMALALIAVAQSGQLQNVNLKTLYEMSQPPIPILTPSGGSTPSGDVTPVNKTPVEPTGSTEDDDFAPFKEAPMPVKGSPINIQPIISQPPPPPASSSFILPPPPLPAPSSQYTIPPCERELSSSPPPRDVLNASPTPSIDSLGSADLPDPIMDKFSTFQSASEDSSVPSESMYPPLSSEDEYADFKSADSDTSSSMSSSRASSRTSSSHNTDPELVGYPQSPVDPDFPTSASSSPASLKYQRSYKRSTTRSTTKSTMKLTKDSFTSAKISPPKNLKLNQPVQSVNLNPSKFGTVRECESDDFAEFKQAAHTRGTFSNAPSVIAPPGQPLTFPIKPPVQDEFADFQQAPLPTRQNSDLFKFNESADDKYAALRDLIAPQTNEPDDEFTDFQTGSCDQDEFADFKKVQPSSGFEESNEFSDFQGPKEPTSAIDEFSDFKGPTESDIVEDEFGQFKDAAKIDNIDEFGDFKQEALPPEEPLGFRGGMAGGFFQSDVVESETITLPPSDMFSAIKDLYNKDDAVITSKIQTNFKEDKEETHNLFNREPSRVRAISMNDDDDDFFGRRPPGLPDFDDEDDEFNNYNTPPVVHDDLFTPVATDKPTNKPANKFDMFGGQEFTAKVDKSSEFSNANDVITLNNHETIGKKTLPDLATDDKFDAFKASTLSDDKYSVFRDLTPQDTTNKNKEIDTETKLKLHSSYEKHEGSSTEENWKAVNEQKLKVLPPSGDEDDLFGNLGPEPPGYHGNINKDNNYGDFSTTSGSSRTLDSVSLNSKESDSISIDNVTMRKSLPKLDSLPSLDLKRFESDDDSDFGDFNTAATDTTSTNGIEITAKEDKSLDHRIGAMVLSTGPPPGPPPNLNQAATVPWLVADRYANIVGDIEDNERHTYEWQRCLQSCYDNVKKANDIFNSISCSSVCLQVTKSEEGSNYLQAVVEIYRVACRVRTSIKSSGFENAGILKLLKDIDLIWNNLAAFLAGSSFLPDDSYFVFKGAILKCDPENAPKACGVCLLSVDSRSKAFDKSKDNHKLTYGGRQYHSTCANLWVNLVDSILPSLPLPSLL